MLKSMTGYGKALCELENKKITIEIKSINSKQADINTRIPSFYKDKELEIRNDITNKLQRGKIDFSMYVEITGEVKNYSINRYLASAYYKDLNAISKELSIENNSDLLAIMMRMPDILQYDVKELDEKEWSIIKSVINEAIDKVDQYRINEGKALEKDSIHRIGLIEDYLKKIEVLEPKRIENIRERITNNLSVYFDKKEIDKNRLEQELIYYVEKIDITEEKVRLKTHCKYFLETLSATDSGNGKKINFITQEIGREINTIGSKANDANIQKLVVEMKDELEKIKEQSANVL